MATSVIYFSLTEFRPLNPNFFGGRHQPAEAARTTLRVAVPETDAPIPPCSHVQRVRARFLLPPGLVLCLPGDCLSTRVTSVFILQLLHFENKVRLNDYLEKVVKWVAGVWCS